MGSLKNSENYLRCDNSSIKGTLCSAKPGCRVAQLVECLVTSGYPDGSSSGPFTTRRYAIVQYICCPVCTSSWVLVWRLLSTYRTRRYKESQVSRKSGYFPPEKFPNSRFRKISPQRVDRVVSKIHWQSKLLTTLATIDASWLDALAHYLLHVRRP